MVDLLLTLNFNSPSPRYKLPFDRHDWIVDRCGTEVRYVIDFYQGEVPQGDSHQAPPSAFFLDVRCVSLPITMMVPFLRVV